MNPQVLLLTKTNFESPRDGGTLRVAAIVNELKDQLGASVESVYVEGGSKNARLPDVARIRLLISNVRVLLAFLRIGSISAARWYRPRTVRELVAVQTSNDVAIRVIEYTQLIGYRALLSGPIILDMHNIESELMTNYASSSSGLRSLVARYEATRLRRLEATIGQHAEIVSVVSEHDRETIVSMLSRPPRKIVVAPNGVSDEGFAVNADRRSEVVFVAHLGWAPNVDAAEWLCREVWPKVIERMPGARLKLVGRSPAKRVLRLRGRTVEVLPDVPSVLPYVASAGVATAPLLAAGGTRLKILEALSCGTPVVATTLGALGLESLDPQVLRVCDGADDFAQAILGAIETPVNPALARQAAETYRWPFALRALVQACSKSAS